MALIRRTVAATLAALALAGTAAQPAQAYWHATGQGTRTVSTSSGVTKVLTLSLNIKPNSKVSAFGNAGTGAGYGSTVSLVLCSVNTWPCPTGSILANQPSLSTSGGTSMNRTPRERRARTEWTMSGVWRAMCCTPGAP